MNELNKQYESVLAGVGQYDSLCETIKENLNSKVKKMKRVVFVSTINSRMHMMLTIGVVDLNMNPRNYKGLDKVEYQEKFTDRGDNRKLAGEAARDFFLKIKDDLPITTNVTFIKNIITDIFPSSKII
jgi:hypothetical protein